MSEQQPELKPDFRLSNGNSKLKKDGIWSFNLVPIKHCPMAGSCKKFCYATVGQQAFPSGVARRERAFLATQAPDFVERMIAEVKRSKAKIVRIHDSGDFYSLKYFQSWCKIAEALPEVRFYAHTKMIPFLKVARPSNFGLIQSYGGIADSMINTAYPHARIFESLEELLAAGYVDTSESDLPAAMGETKIGLVIHGAKKNISQGRK